MKKVLIGLIVGALLLVSWVATTPVDAATPHPPATVTGHWQPDAPYGSATQPQMAHWTWGWVTGTVYLSRNETSQLSFGASLSGILGAVVSVGAVAATFGSLAAYAAYVYRQGHCVKFKLYPGAVLLFAVPGEYWGTAGGGYCR